MPKRAFRAKTRVALPDESFEADCRQTLVNYIWINAVPDVYSPDGPMCSIPLQYVQRAVDNANNYPDISFKLWIDSRLVSDESRFWLASFLYDGLRQQNMEICDLRTLPEYARSRVFKRISPLPELRKHRGSVYVRADYARILVLKHCAKTCRDKRFLIYSDLDCKDIWARGVLSTLRVYGIAINHMGHSDSVSHGFIALDTANKTVMAPLDRLCRETASAANAGELGYMAFGAYLARIYPMYSENSPSIRHYLLPGVCHTLPPVPFLQQLKIN